MLLNQLLAAAADRDERESVSLRVELWTTDAVQGYTQANGKWKKAISTTSLPVYMCHIDKWWAEQTENTKGLLSLSTKDARKLLTANFRAAGRQVHGLKKRHLDRLVEATNQQQPATARPLAAAFTLAWYAMLRPSEYMTTPRHNKFDPSRHMRRGDIQFYCGKRRMNSRDTSRQPTHMTVEIKQSKTDWARIGATLTLGTTGDPTCPVTNMHRYLSASKHSDCDELFPGLTYTRAIHALRNLMHDKDAKYGMHSFRVGGCQALALAGRSHRYIMARGRWKSIESVLRYVETPLDFKLDDTVAMAQASSQRHPTSVWGHTLQTQSGV